MVKVMQTAVMGLFSSIFLNLGKGLGCRALHQQINYGPVMCSREYEVDRAVWVPALLCLC